MKLRNATTRVLPDGKVQVIGGDASFSMEIYDPATGGFNAVLPSIPEMLDATLTMQGRSALTNTNIAQHPTVGSLLTPDRRISAASSEARRRHGPLGEFQVHEVRKPEVMSRGGGGKSSAFFYFLAKKTSYRMD